MAEVKIRKTETEGSHNAETVFEAKDVDTIHMDVIKALFGEKSGISGAESEVKVSDCAENAGIRHDVVAIYDNAGIPSIMHRFTLVTNAKLFGGSEKPHPAFVIGGEVYDEIYISVYENCNINGKPYSLPYQKAWVNITNDEAAAACFSKGEGWHMLTAVEWGLLANISLKNGTLPHGNTYSGKYHADAEECGELYDPVFTLTGSGPVAWTHDHTPEGVHDLSGNHWEMVRGLRVTGGTLQAAQNNDAALDIDLTPNGDGWQNIMDDCGKPVRASVDEGITLTVSENIDRDYDGDNWKDVTIECESEQLKELALYAGEPYTYLHIDSTDGEYFPIRGGSWGNGPTAGVFCISMTDSRSFLSRNLGFRSAYFKKRN